MKRVALLTVGLLTICCYPVMAKSPHGHRHTARTVHHSRVAHHNRLAHHTRVEHHTSATRHADPARHVAAEGESHSGITCEMVRAYVAQVGLAQATAMAQANGITAAEKDRARRCLAQKS